MNLHTPSFQDSANSPTPMTAALSRVLARMPSNISTSLTPAQLAALDKALDFNNPTPHPLNLRITLFGLYYLVVIAGPEQRNPKRRSQERDRYPLLIPGNIAFLTGIAILGMAFGYTLRSLIVGG